MSRGASRIFTGLALLLAAAALAPAGVAHAWTRTEVSTMRAHADVTPAGRARVSLEIGLHVRGGWLERFELASLGGAVVLDPGKPPVLWNAEGKKHAGDGRLTPDGRLLIDLGDRKHAPRRGSYRLRVVYETPLAPGASPELRALPLPAWPLALSDVQLSVRAPRGTRFAPSEEGALEERTTLSRGGFELLHLTRAQLPRTRVLEAQMALPELATQASLEAAPAPGDEHGSGRTVAAVLVVLALLLTKLGLLRAARIGPPPEACASRPRTRRVLPLDLARARRERLLRYVAPSSALDATTPLGLCVLVSCAACATLLACNTGDSLALQALLVASPLWLLGAQTRAPLSTADALLALHALVPAIAARAGDAAAVRFELTSHGAIQRASAPRIALRPRRRPEGLLAVRLVVARRPHGPHTFAWQLIARAGSPAVPRIELLPAAIRTTPAPLADAVAFLAPVERPTDAVAELLEALAQPTPIALEHTTQPARAA